MKTHFLQDIIDSFKGKVDPYFSDTANKLFDNKENHGYLLNSGERIAINLLCIIFNKSEVIHLFANNEKPNVADNIVYERAVRGFLSRNGKIYLVVKNKIDYAKAFRVYKLLYTYAIERPDLVKIADADDIFFKDVSEIFKKDKEYNFCVGDKRFIRSEFDTERFYAHVLNSDEIGENLASIIEKCIERQNILKREKIKTISELMV